MIIEIVLLRLLGLINCGVELGGRIAVLTQIPVLIKKTPPNIAETANF